MDPINLLRLGQVIQQEMLERAALDQLGWTPRPWRQWIGGLLKSMWETLTRADNSVQRLATPAQHAIDESCTTPDMTSECC